MLMPQLVGCQQLAHEPDGTKRSLPPLEFDYQDFSTRDALGWQPLTDWAEFNYQYQMVDLNGEGMPGMLYQDSGHWIYRPPVRQPGTADGITLARPNGYRAYPRCAKMPC